MVLLEVRAPPSNEGKFGIGFALLKAARLSPAHHVWPESSKNGWWLSIVF